MKKTTSSGAPRKAPIVLFIGALSAIVLLVHARSYMPLMVDDAYISLRYAMRLLQGQGLTWTDGEAVEGYSNLLWVLGCAALGGLGLDLVDAARVLGLACAMLTMAAFLFAFPPRSWSQSLPALAGTLFVSLAGPIAMWSIAGLEACMVAALLAWGLVLLRPLLDGAEPDWRTVLIPGIPLALLCLTRLDAALMVGTICAFLLIQAKSVRGGLLAAFGVGALPALALLGQTAFRLAYYGDWLPNTARAKVAFTEARIGTGMKCVTGAWDSSLALWIAAALALYVFWRDRSRRSRITLAVILLAVWTGYTVAVICWELGYRNLIPWFVLLPYLVAEALDWIVGRGRLALGAAWIATLAALLLFGWAQQNDRNNTMGRKLGMSLEGRAEAVGTLLRRSFTEEDPLVAVDAAGIIPYYSQLRSLDMLGLNDAHISRSRNETFGRGLQGHELGDGSYVLEREPDIVISGKWGGRSLSYVGGREMEADSRFTDWYRPVNLYAEDPRNVRSVIWVRLEGRIGLQRSDAEIRIPGYFFASAEGVDARLDSSGELRAVFKDAVSAPLNNIELPAGVWRLETHGSGPFPLSVRRHSDGESFSSEEGNLEFVIDEPGAVDLTVMGQPESFLVEVVAHHGPD
jgi:arabinofuranosyltransferase